MKDLRSANEIGLDLNYSVEELIELSRKLVDMNQIENWGNLYSSNAWCS